MSGHPLPEGRPRCGRCGKACPACLREQLPEGFDVVQFSAGRAIIVDTDDRDRDRVTRRALQPDPGRAYRLPD